MQRKNHTLRKSLVHFKNGMAMIMAIMVIVILATIMAFSISLTSETTKRSTDIYFYEQSVLLAKSTAEYALLQIALHPPCSDLDENFTQNGIYNISMKIKYIYDSNASCITNGGTLYTTITTTEQNGSILLDVSVEVNDTTVATEPIRYFRRTIQKL